MNEEKINKIVELVNQIAAANATIRLNIFCESSENAAHNTTILENRKQELKELLIKISANPL